MVCEARQVSKSIVESILADVFRAEIRRNIENILGEVVDTVELDYRNRRIFDDIIQYDLVNKTKECIRMEEKRKRILMKLEKEQKWLSKRKQKPGGVMDMDWEEHSLEACPAMLGLSGKVWSCPSFHPSGRK